ncbi:MAG: STAS domain-containing protein [Lentisphaeria bacterium]|nr:STAS domain-containing protein [Lentisphaeria bacterium]
MQDKDILISNSGNVYNIKVCGRANFEYAVPLRHLANCLNSNIEKICIDGSECTFMDSTFMGVMSMIGLRSKKCGTKVEIYGMAPNVRALLKGLGVDKLFTFFDNVNDMQQSSWEELAKQEKNMLETAETVSEAHKVLVEADDSNEARFHDVIKFADEDIARLRDADKK